MSIYRVGARSSERLTRPSVHRERSRRRRYRYVSPNCYHFVHVSSAVGTEPALSKKLIRTCTGRRRAPKLTKQMKSLSLDCAEMPPRVAAAAAAAPVNGQTRSPMREFFSGKREHYETFGPDSLARKLHDLATCESSRFER